MRRFAPIWRHTAHFAHHIDITLQNVPKREYTLRLLIGNQEIQVQQTADRFWTPIQPQYALSSLTTYTRRRLCVSRDAPAISPMLVNVQMRVGHSFWATTRQNSNAIEIDIQGLLKKYWNSTEHEFKVPGQPRSHTSPLVSNREPQRPFPSGSTMGI